MLKDRLTRYKELSKEMQRLPYKCGKWMPSMHEIRTQIMKDPYYYIDFIVWLIETSDRPAEDTDRKSLLVLERILNNYKEGECSGNRESEIEDVVLPFDEYTRICDKLGDEPYPACWPDKRELAELAHRAFKEHLLLFVRLDEYGPVPVNNEEKESRRYVNAVLKNHLILKG